MKSKNLNKNIKNSLVLGGLVGTAGLFVAKLLGLLYSIPLSSILAQDDLQAYYGTAYQLYSYVLNICTAGFPFAISTIVAKYTVLQDSKALLAVKKISTRVLTVLGAVGMIALMAFSGLIAKNVVGDTDPSTMTVTMCILSMAVFFVPILSAYRGFWQGRKEMTEYALSQTFEQIFRVGFLLSMAYMIVYMLHMERKYALYAAVLSTSVAAVAGILQIYVFDKKNIGEIKDEAAAQTAETVDEKKLFKELVLLALPYLGTAVIGYVDELFNSLLLPIGLRLHGYTTTESSVILSAFNYVGYKLTSIPQILSPGFAVALIPHVTEALTNHDHKKVSKIVAECIGIVVFIGSMASFCITIYAVDIYHVLFRTSDPVLSASVVRWLSVEGFLGTICPVTSSLMIALGFKKDVLRRQLISAILKGAVMIPMIQLFGFPGAVLSSVVGNTYIFLGNLHQIDQKYNIELKTMFSTFGRVAAALAAMFAVSYGLRMIGIAGDHGGRLAALGLVVINGMAAVVTYFTASHFLKIPQDLFHKDILSVILGRFRRKQA